MGHSIGDCVGIMVLLADYRKQFKVFTKGTIVFIYSWGIYFVVIIVVVEVWWWKQ